jgi:hypothetical protein
MKHAKAELLARIKARLEQAPAYPVYVNYGHGGFLAIAIKGVSASNVEFLTDAQHTVIIGAEDIIYVEFYNSEATRNSPSGGASDTQE